jgi:Domain of unknown function (DUF4352)
MNTKPNFSIFTLLVLLVVVSLTAAACAPSKPAPTPVVIKPTQIPAKPQPTVAPTRPQPTIAPTHPKPTATAIVAPTTVPATNGLPLGEAQFISDVSVTPSTFEWLSESGSDKPASGDRYLVVTFSIENTSKTADFSFDPSSLVILNPAGTASTMVSLKSLTNELTAQTLKPGAKLNGVIAYELPMTENKWSLELKGTNNQNLMWSNAG